MAFLTPVKQEAPAKPGKPAEKRPEINVKKVEKAAALAALIEALTTRYLSLDEEIRGACLEYSIEAGAASGLRPETPNVLEGIGSMQYQTKNRSPLSALTEEAYKELKDAGIPVKVNVIAPKMLAVNPKYAEDTKLLAKVDKALANVGLPEDFIIQTAEVSKKITDQGAIEAVFATKDKDKIAKFLPMVSTASLAQIKVSDFDRAMEIVKPEVELLFGEIKKDPNFKIKAPTKEKDKKAA